MDIWMAAGAVNLERLHQLLEEGANLNRSRWSGVTPLHRASAAGQNQAVEWLLENGVDVNCKTAWGWYTPLHQACAEGNLETAMLLLNAGADWHVHDKNNRTPMQWALDKGHLIVGQKLDQHVSKVEKKEKKRRLEEEKQARLRQIELAAEQKAARLRKFEEEKEAEKTRQDAARLMAAEMSALAANIGIKAAEAATFFAAEAAEAKSKIKDLEPEFYRELQKELTEEEFVDILNSSPAHAKALGISAKNFRIMKQIAKAQGKL